jgi:hypothetical protein
MAAGSTGISLILPQAEDQPSLSALRASLAVLSQGFFPLLVLFFLMHDLFSRNARAAHCETKFSPLNVTAGSDEYAGFLCIHRKTAVMSTIA